jgi:hypothetical protein
MTKQETEAWEALRRWYEATEVSGAAMWAYMAAGNKRRWKRNKHLLERLHAAQQAQGEAENLLHEACEAVWSPLPLPEEPTTP